MSSTITGNVITADAFVGDGSQLTGVSAGKVLQVVRYSMLQVTAPAGSAKLLAQSNTFVKERDTSKVIINISAGYSNSSYSSTDDNSALFLMNTTTGNYLNDRTIYNEADAFWAVDTNNAYGNSMSAGAFQYHGYTLNAVLEDTAAQAGSNTYILQMSAQHSTLHLCRWFCGSITITEIAQ